MVRRSCYKRPIHLYSTQKGFVFFTLIFSDNKSLNICSKIHFVGAQFFIVVDILGKMVIIMGMSLYYRLCQLKNFVKTMKLKVVGTWSLQRSSTRSSAWLLDSSLSPLRSPVGVPPPLPPDSLPPFITLSYTCSITLRICCAIN